MFFKQSNLNMNRFTKLLKSSIQLNKFRTYTVVKTLSVSECRKLCTNYKASYVHNLHNSKFNVKTLDAIQKGTNTRIKTVLAISLLTWLGLAKEDEEKESELIMTLKRAVLCIQREQYQKAEQMLHLALRIAQQQQNEEGIVYCYDLMANLAFEQHDLNKAHKLFVSVLQKLLSSGTAEDDLKVIHISLKLARIRQLVAELEQADIGYKWCLIQIDKKKTENVDAKILYGVINDWYAQYLLDIGDTNKALVHLKEAHTICSEIIGDNSEKAMLLLNDLGTTSFRAEDMVNAEKYLKEAVDIGKTLEDKSHLGVVHANLGLILLEKGIIDLAEKYCKEAWQLGTKHENSESINQASYCLDQIKMNIKDKVKS